MIGKAFYRVWRLFVNSRRFWDLVAAHGIVVFVGPNGSGKSLVGVQSELAALDGMSWECWDVEHRHHKPFRDHADVCEVCDQGMYLPHAAGSRADVEALVDDVICSVGRDVLAASSSGERLVYSTVPLVERKGVPHPRFVPLVDYQQLLTIEHADVFFDEVAGISDASGSASMPVQVINWQHKLRKADIRQRVTTPAYARCSLPIRQVAQIVVECRSMFPARSKGRLWRPRRLVVAKAYDAFRFEDFIGTDGQREKLKPMAKALIWVPDSKAKDHYNTLGQVLALGHITESGMCIVCAGTKSRPRCACPTDLSALDPADVQVEEHVTAAGTRSRVAVPLSSTGRHGGG